MVLAAEDSIVSTPSCLERAAELRRSGATVENAVIPDADHAFDQREKSPLSTLPFDPGRRATARQIVEEFLEAHAP